MDASGLREKLNTAPVDFYVFGGEEEYLKRYYLSQLRTLLVPDETFAPFNHVVFDGPEVDFGALADAVKAPPMSSPTAMMPISRNTCFRACITQIPLNRGH